ncbi:hypothetical protein Pelo_12769 [Pelomyxa schiedti]|nr:hypothetical protein Pelo_12769 [Pelomyxa schiedti]
MSGSDFSSDSGGESSEADEPTPSGTAPPSLASRTTTTSSSQRRDDGCMADRRQRRVLIAPQGLTLDENKPFRVVALPNPKFFHAPCPQAADRCLQCILVESTSCEAATCPNSESRHTSSSATLHFRKKLVQAKSRPVVNKYTQHHHLRDQQYRYLSCRLLIVHHLLGLLETKSFQMVL